MTPPDEFSGAEPPADKGKVAKEKNNARKTNATSKKTEAGPASKPSRTKKLAVEKTEEKSTESKPEAAVATSTPETGSKISAQKKPAAAKPAELPPLSQSAPSSGRLFGRAIGTAVLILLAGVLGGVVATFWADFLPIDEQLAAADPIVAARVNELQAKIDELENQASDARTQADALEDSLDELKQGSLDETARLVGKLDNRVAGLEQAVADIINLPIEEGTPVGPATILELTSGLSNVRQSLTELQGEVGSRIGALEATVPPVDLDQILRDLAPRDDVSTLASRVASLEDDRTGSDAKRAALALALANLSRAAETGLPFDAELEAVAILAPDQAAIKKLRARATEGLPTRADLAADFETVIEGVLDVERATEADGWLARIWAWLNSFVSVRQTGNVEGEDTEAILARAEFKLDDGKLQAVADELAQLDGPGAEAAAVWKGALDAHIALDELIGTLTTQVLTSLGQ